MTKRKILMLAGPNGAGKTTFARSFLPAEAECIRFINADLIASGLSPFAPEAEAIRAGRLMFEEISQCLDKGESFALETTLSGQGYRRHISEWRNLGYHVSIYFLTLSSPELAIARVAERVLQGGHNIPENVIRRRFESGRKNFDKIYRALVDSWILYDNNGPSPVPTEWST
jgi:predicted ABC-type ATPase